jgi:hypothetical protein
VFDRAAGMKLPRVEARSIEEPRAYEMPRIGVNTLATDGAILPPCHRPPTTRQRLGSSPALC